MHKRAYNGTVRVDWDGRKAAGNLSKHGIDFVDAVPVLFDEHSVTAVDERAGEHRSVTIGADATGRVLVVVWMWRAGCVRIISARMATPRERRRFEEQR